MNFEQLQTAWQSQPPGAKVTISADLLLKEVRRNQNQFRKTILLRDMREVGACLFLFVFFTQRGWGDNDWTDILVGLSCLGVGVFMVADRLRQHRKRPVANDSLRGCVETSLHQINHQIWLLKNVLWWYMLPIMLTTGISVCVHLWQTRHNGLSAVVAFAFCLVIFALVDWGVYKLNQYAVRKTLQPRQRELEALLNGLE
jgi:hypothetical protein